MRPADSDDLDVDDLSELDNSDIDFDYNDEPDGSGVEDAPDESSIHDDDEDIVFDDDDDIVFDDDDVDYGEESGSRFKDLLKNKRVMFIAAGGLVLLLGIAGGAGYWFLVDDTPVASVERAEIKSGKRVELVLPSKGKGLNNLSLNSLAKEDEESDAVSGDPAEPEPENEATPPEDDPQPAVGLADARPQALGDGTLNSFAIGDEGPGAGIVIPSTTSSSFRNLPDLPAAEPLTNAPVEALLDALAGGEEFIPKVGDDGKTPWETYGRPSDSTITRPRVGIMVTGLGLSRAATIAAITKLPAEVSLAFSPYAKDLNDWMVRSRRAGHEVFLELPMESSTFPLQDAGPLALSTQMDALSNMRKLVEVMSRFVGYTGVVSTMGSKFNADEAQLMPLLNQMKKRGLMFVDGSNSETTKGPLVATKIDMPRAHSNMSIDSIPSKNEIDERLKELINLAKTNSVAIATAQAYPVTYERLAKWISLLGANGMVLVPVSALANKQFVEGVQ